MWRVHPCVLSLFFRWTPQQFVPPLWAISTGLLRVVVVQVCIAVVGLLALWHISRHCHSNHLQPALLQLLTFSSKVMDGLGLREAEAGWRVHGPGAVFHGIAQEGDGALRLHVLRRVCRDLEVAMWMDRFDMLLCYILRRALAALPEELCRDRAPATPSRGWRTTPSATVCFFHSTAGSRRWCCCPRTELPQSARRVGTAQDINTETVCVCVCV